MNLKKTNTLLLLFLMILLLSSCSGKSDEMTDTSSIEDTSENTTETVTMETQLTIMEGMYLTEESKGTMPDGYELHPYIIFESGGRWRMGSDPMFSYGRDGKFTQDGDIIKAKRQDGANAPIDENLYIEFQILSETELKVVNVSEDFYSSFNAAWEWLSEGDVLLYSDPEEVSTEESTDSPAALTPPKQFVGTWEGVSNNSAIIVIDSDGTAKVNQKTAEVVYVQDDINGRVIKIRVDGKESIYEYKLQGNNAMISIGNDGDLSFYRQGSAHPIEQFVGKWITDSDHAPEWNGAPVKEFSISADMEMVVNGKVTPLAFNYLDLRDAETDEIHFFIKKEGNTLRLEMMGGGFAIYRRAAQE